MAKAKAKASKEAPQAIPHTAIPLPMPKVREALDLYERGQIDAANCGITLYVGLFKTAFDPLTQKLLTTGERLAQLEADGYTVQWLLSNDQLWSLQLTMRKGSSALPVTLGAYAPFVFRKQVDDEQGKDSKAWFEDLKEQLPKVYQQQHEAIYGTPYVAPKDAEKPAEAD